MARRRLDSVRPAYGGTPRLAQDRFGYVPAASRDLTGAETVDYVATRLEHQPTSPAAILEYKSGALSQGQRPSKTYILTLSSASCPGIKPELSTAHLGGQHLNNGYYGWRTGTLTEFTEPDGTIIRPDPWQNAATVAIEYFFSRTSSGSEYDAAVGPSGLARTYEILFGRPVEGGESLIPGSLQQPAFTLPFQRQQVWTYTGGPHSGWGIGEPYPAVDFAPPCDGPGCGSLDPRNYVVAMAAGLVARSGPDGVMLDLDGDGDERTGWNIFYLHLAGTGRVALGQNSKQDHGLSVSRGGGPLHIHRPQIQPRVDQPGQWLSAWTAGWCRGLCTYLGNLRGMGSWYGVACQSLQRIRPRHASLRRSERSGSMLPATNFPAPSGSLSKIST
jgi:hypothetical protein